MNIKKYEEIKRRIVALALASSIGFTSFALSGCKSKNDIIDGEASNGYSSVLDRDNSIDMNNSGEWFCDVWAEDYDNNKISGIKFELRDNKNNLIEDNAFYSDDTILTIATLDAILNNKDYD